MPGIHARIDRQIGILVDAVEAALHAEDDDPEVAIAAKVLKDEVFMNGAVDYTRLPYLEQNTAVQDLVAVLQGNYAAQVGLTGKVKGLAKLSLQYNDASGAVRCCRQTRNRSMLQNRRAGSVWC